MESFAPSHPSFSATTHGRRSRTVRERHLKTPKELERPCLEPTTREPLGQSSLGLWTEGYRTRKKKKLSWEKPVVGKRGHPFFGCLTLGRGDCPSPLRLPPAPLPPTSHLRIRHAREKPPRPHVPLGVFWGGPLSSPATGRRLFLSECRGRAKVRRLSSTVLSLGDV